jgi:hypothetical protein
VSAFQSSALSLLASPSGSTPATRGMSSCHGGSVPAGTSAPYTSTFTAPMRSACSRARSNVACALMPHKSAS